MGTQVRQTESAAPCQLLAPADSKAGRLQRDCLDLLTGPKHAVEGGHPSSIRTLFYELEMLGIVTKDKPRGKRTDGQNVSDALMHLREVGLVPWDWIVDETRSLDMWVSAQSVYAYIRDAIARARIDCWGGGPAPLILSESRGVQGEQRALAAEYLCPITGTSGQVGGFLRTDIIPILVRGQHVLYIGDFDWAGGQIEANTRKVLEAGVGRLEWERIALTGEQVERHGLGYIEKRDRRYRDGKPHRATEVEEFGQLRVREALRRRLDELLPEPLADVRIREDEERAEVVRRLADAP